MDYDHNIRGRIKDTIKASTISSTIYEPESFPSFTIFSVLRLFLRVYFEKRFYHSPPSASCVNAAAAVCVFHWSCLSTPVTGIWVSVSLSLLTTTRSPRTLSRVLCCYYYYFCCFYFCSGWPRNLIIKRPWSVAQQDSWWCRCAYCLKSLSPPKNCLQEEILIKFQCLEISQALLLLERWEEGGVRWGEVGRQADRNASVPVGSLLQFAWNVDLCN